MKLNASQSSALDLPKSISNADVLSIVFAGLALAAGGGMALVGIRLGWVALLAIPAVIFALAVLLRPDLGLALFVFIIYIQLTLVLSTYHHGLPSPAQPLLGLLYFLILWRLFVVGDRPGGWKRTIILLLMILYWLFSVFIADNTTLAFAKFQKFAENASLALVVLFFVQKPSSLKMIIWAILFAGLFMGTLTLIQNLVRSFGNEFWGFAQWQSASTDGVTNHRAAGPYGNPNGYAQVLVMLAPLALDRVWHERDLPLRFLAGWAFAVCILAVFFTYSRNGFVSLLFAVGCLVIMRRPRIMPLAVTILLALLLVQFLPAAYLNRISTIFQFSSADSPQQISDVSFRGRLSENTAAWQMFLDHPVFGVGLDNFEINYQAYSRKIGLDSRRDTRAPASFYLELLSEQGLVGTLLFLIFILSVFRNLWQAAFRFGSSRMNDERNITLAFIAGLLGYMFFYISKNSAYSNVFWILLGIAFSIAQVAESGAAPAGVRGRLLADKKAAS